MDDKIKIDLSVSDETTETKRNSQARDWCFTINNPVQTEQEFMEYLQTVKDLRYVVFQRERAPETGTEHYQGYFEFTQPKWFSGIKKCLSKEHIGVDAHIEARRGKRSQAREYCMDEETRISPQYYEYGEFIEDGERTDLTDIMHDIENGMSFYIYRGRRTYRLNRYYARYRKRNEFLRPFQKTRQPLYPRYEMGKRIQAIALGKQVQAGVSQYESLLHIRLGGVRKDKLCIPKTRL